MKQIIILLLFALLGSTTFGQSDSIAAKIRKEKMNSLNQKLGGYSNQLVINADGSIGHFIDKDGQKVLIFQYSPDAKGDADNFFYKSNYLLTTDKLHYYTKDGKYIKLKQSKISELFIGGDHYTRLKIGSAFGLNRLHKIIIASDNYVLTEYFSNGAFYYYLFNLQTQKFEYKKVRSVVKSKKDRKLAEKYILPYFKDCSKFNTRITRNLSNDYKQLVGPNVRYYSRMTAGISNMKCE